MVHGGAKIIDPFRDLSYMELGAIVGHPDLWLVFDNFFEEAKDDWKAKARTIRSDMLLALAEVQLLNEQFVTAGNFNFSYQGIPEIPSDGGNI